MRVVDSSVAAKWFLEEAGSASARQLLLDEDRLVAPELLLAELGNILWKKVRGGELSAELAQAISATITDEQSFDVQLVPTRELLRGAVELAIRHERSVYDSLYLAAAVALDVELVTADVRLARAMAGTGLGSRVRVLDELPMG